jgi:hypothetical protein
MNIPKIWAKSEEKITGPRGPMTLTAWGWSNGDREEASRLASERLQHLINRVRRSQELEHSYAYGTRPLREEIIREVRSRTGDITGLVTRNGYGCLVLNAAETMFIDVDLPKTRAADKLRNFFGKKHDFDQEYSDKIKTRLLATCTASFRIYRTAAGFRVLITDRLFKPSSADAEAIMSAISADPAYMKLCRLQESFRARLTPKPWRCEMARPPSNYPREFDFERKAFAGWLEEYERNVSDKGTCRLVEAVDHGWVHETIQPILDIHDKETRVNANLILA